MLANYLEKHRIKLNICASNWEEAIEKAGNILLDDKVIEISYIDAMKKTIKEIGAYFVVTKHVALAHAKSEEGVLKTGVSLITLKTPIYFGNLENDPVKYVFCLAVKETIDHIEILKELSEILEDRNFFRLLDSEKDVQKIYKYIK